MQPFLKYMEKVKVYLYRPSQTKMAHGYSVANVVPSRMYKPNPPAKEPKGPAEQYQESAKKEWKIQDNEGCNENGQYNFLAGRCCHFLPVFVS